MEIATEVTMLRMYLVQQWFNLSDPAVEEALYESISMRQFVGIDLGREPVPDETTLCKFRHLLERHDLGRRLFEELGRHLQEQGMQVSPALGMQSSTSRLEGTDRTDFLTTSSDLP